MIESPCLTKKLFKDYLRERRNEHIEAVKSNVYTGAYTLNDEFRNRMVM